MKKKDMADKVKSKKTSNSKKIKKQKDSTFSSLKKMVHNTSNSIYLGGAIGLFILTVLLLSFGLKTIIFKQESKPIYFDDSGIKYIEIDNGFIAQELVIRSGDKLPEINEYFSEGYSINENATILYYENDELVNVDDFTYEEEGTLYVRGTRSIDITIINDSEYSTKLVIIDDENPEVIVKNLTITQGEELDPNNFVESFKDNNRDSSYVVNFDTELDYSEVGTYEFDLRICDSSDNCVDEIATLTVEKKGETTTKPNNSGGTKPSGGNNSSSKPSSGNNSSSTKPSGGNNSSTKPSGGNNSSSNPNGSSSTPDETKSYCSDPVDSFYRSTVYFDALETNALAEIKANPDKQKNAQSTFLTATNAERKKLGLKELVLDEELNTIAMQRMLEILVFQQKDVTIDCKGVEHPNTHVRPTGESWQRFYYYQYHGNDFVGENFTWGSTGAIADNKGAINELIKSPGHKAVMIRKEFTKMGVAKYSDNGINYWIQIFA